MHTCLNMVPIPDPSRPSNISFWTLFCSKYSGTDLFEKEIVSKFDPSWLPLRPKRGEGNDNKEQSRRVDACLEKVILFKIYNLFCDQLNGKNSII